MRFVASTPCFRKEAGSYGKDTKGIIRPVEWQRFRSNMIVNPRINYDSPLYEENKFAIIGGLSKNSSHFNSKIIVCSFLFSHRYTMFLLRL